MDSRVESQLSSQSLARQVGLAVCASLSFLSSGLFRGYTSSAIPSMQKTAPHLVPDTSTISWIQTASLVTGAPSMLLVGPVVQAVGRRRVLQVAAPLAALCWLGVATAPSPPLLIASRALFGVALSALCVSAPLYVAECSDRSVRGVLGSLPGLASCLGTLLSYVLGTMLRWDALALVSAAAPLLLFLGLFVLPESPAWLALTGREEEAARARQWLGLRHEEARQSLLGRGTKHPWRRAAVVPFLLSVMVFTLQQTCGNDVVIFNTVSILEAARGSLNAHTATVMVGLVHMVFTFGSLYTVDRLGRKFNLMLSALVMSLSIGSLAVFFDLRSAGHAPWSFLPASSLIVYIAGYSIGFATVPFLLMSELIPLDRRGSLGSLAFTLGVVAMFLELKTYHSLVEWLGQSGPFWIYASFNLLAVFLVKLLIPETKGKTLDEIEKHFEKLDT